MIIYILLLFSFRSSRVWRVRSLGINVKRVAYERIVVLNVRKKEIECNGN